MAITEARKKQIDNLLQERAGFYLAEAAEHFEGFKVNGILDNYRFDKSLNAYTRGIASANPYLNSDSRDDLKKITNSLYGPLMDEQFELYVESSILARTHSDISNLINGEGHLGGLTLSGDDIDYLKGKQTEAKRAHDEHGTASQPLHDKYYAHERAAQVIAGNLIVTDDPAVEAVLNGIGSSIAKATASASNTVKNGNVASVLYECNYDPKIELDSFVQKALKGAELTHDEKEYGVGAFDNAMSGMFGAEGNSLVPEEIDSSHSMYLGKFDLIFVDGKSVREHCKDQMADINMDIEAMSEHMKSFVSACAVSRDKKIECMIPPVEFVNNPQTGLNEKKYKIPFEPSEAKIVPVIARIASEKSPSLWSRFKAAVNKVTIKYFDRNMFDPEPPTNADYTNQFDETEAERDARHKACRESAADFNDRCERDEIRRIYARNDKAMGEIRPRKYLHNKNDPQTKDLTFSVEDMGGFTYMKAENEGRATSVIDVYMFSKGISPQRIAVDTSPEMDSIRREKSLEYYNILKNGSAEEIAQVHADMAKKLMEYEIPEYVDFNDPIKSANYYPELKTVSNFGVALNSILSVENGVLTLNSGKPGVNEKFKEIMGDDNHKKMANAYNNSMSLLGVYAQAQDIYKLRNPDFSSIEIDAAKSEWKQAHYAQALTVSSQINDALNSMRGTKLYQTDSSKVVTKMANQIDGAANLFEFADYDKSLTPEQRKAHEKNKNDYIMCKTKEGPYEDVMTGLKQKVNKNFQKSDRTLNLDEVLVKEFEKGEIKINPIQKVSYSFDRLDGNKSPPKIGTPPKKEKSPEKNSIGLDSAEPPAKTHTK